MLNKQLNTLINFARFEYMQLEDFSSIQLEYVSYKNFIFKNLNKLSKKRVKKKSRKPSHTRSLKYKQKTRGIDRKSPRSSKTKTKSEFPSKT